MFAKPFGRIFWKEYRVHRALWLSCLVFGILFQIIGWWLADGPHSRASFLIDCARFFPIMYAVGCGALLFASEREERTCEWLLSLSTPVAATLGAKIALAIASTIGLQSVLACLSLILVVGIPDSRLPNLLVLLVPYGLLVLIWSFLGSLMSRSVLISVLAMTFWGAVTICFPNLLLLYTLDGFRQSITIQVYDFWNFVVLSCVMTALIGVDLWLGWRWCQGKYIDGAVIENLNSRYKLWRGALSLSGTTAKRKSLQAEHDQQWRRTWQRLVWQERNRESAHRLLVLVGSAVGVMVAIASVMANERVTGIAYAMIYPIPLAMGIFGFRTEASLRQLRFLAHRGISPTSLWTAKQVVWLPRAFWVTGIVFAVSLLFEFWLVPSPYLFNDQLPLQSLWNWIHSRPDSAVWVVLLGYGSGQLAALLFQRTVLAIGCGIVLNIAAGCWLVLIEQFDELSLPRWWSLGLPVIAMLLATLWQMKPWLLEDHSWSRRWKLVASMFALPVVLITFFVCHRVTEAMTPLRLDPIGVVRFHAATNKQLAERSLTSAEFSARRSLEVLSQAYDTKDVGAADEIVKLMNRDLFSVAWKDEEQKSVFPAKLRTMLVRKADEYFQDGVLDKSFDCHLANLKLVRTTLSHQGVLEWEQGSYFQSLTLDELVNWANHPSQTLASIRNAIKRIEEEMEKYPSATESIVTSYLSNRKIWVLSSRTEVVEELHRLEALGTSESPLVWLLLIPSERMRTDLLMTRDAELSFVAISTLETRLSSPEASANRTVTREFSPIETANRSLTRTTLLLHFCNIPLTDRMQWVLNRRTNIRGALTRMELIAYRLEHGKLPDRLIQLIPSINGINLVDPWSGRLFDYYPEFLLSAGYNGVELLPFMATEVDFNWEGASPNESRRNFSQIINGTPEEINFRLAAMKNDNIPLISLFPIPLQTKPKLQP